MNHILQEMLRRNQERKIATEKLETLCREVLADYDVRGISSVSCWGSGVTFYTDREDHHVATRLMLRFGGKFKKYSDPSYPETMRYTQQRDDIMIEVVSGPPPSCRIEEYEEVLPPRSEPIVVKHKRLVCA